MCGLRVDILHIMGILFVCFFLYVDSVTIKLLTYSIIRCFANVEFLENVKMGTNILLGKPDKLIGSDL